MHEQLIKGIREKITLTEEGETQVKKFFIPKKLRKRQYLLNAGDVCHHIAFVEKGLMRSFSVDEGGYEHVMQFAMEGWWISDMASFLSQEEATYNIEALEEAELLLLTKSAMDEMIDSIPGMERYFRLLMQNSIIALQRRIRVVQTYSAEEVYLKLMEVQPEIISRAPQQHVASYLGITPETLSRIRKQVSTRR
ncbi:MAG TPA: Crp/Fnr family transcriptional regulator [Cyclobacteriaceae bacterium]|nr:Crp/Fnr family transcriptional regulator [Cyclobacteriaceae bacterium]